MAGRVKGLAPRSDHVLVGGWHRRDLCQTLGDGCTRHRAAVSIEDTVLEQHLHDLRHAAGTMEVDRHIPTTGLQVAQDGHPSTDQLEGRRG